MSVNSDALEIIIKDHIQAANGFLSFEHFMRLALYKPELGYYESEHVFGATGDFVTGADLGDWLAMGFADVLHWGWQALDKPENWVLLEQGGGTGQLLAQTIQHIITLDMPMPEMMAVERSAHMRQRQDEVYQQAGLNVQQYAELSDVQTDKPVLMMCNELPDAFPVQVFEWKNGQFYERGVTWTGDKFDWLTAEEPMQNAPDIASSITQTWPEGYISEYNPGLSSWQYHISQLIARGFVFCVDYGYSQQEYYRANRIEGTLMGHKAHQVVENIFEHLGVCDITAHIDFGALANMGSDVDLMPSSFITQGGWLAQSPSVQKQVVRLAQESSVESVQALAHAKRMMLPVGMGESFKLLIQSKGVQAVPTYLQALDRLRDLRTKQ